VHHRRKAKEEEEKNRDVLRKTTSNGSLKILQGNDLSKLMRKYAATYDIGRRGRTEGGMGRKGLVVEVMKSKWL